MFGRQRASKRIVARRREQEGLMIARGLELDPHRPFLLHLRLLDAEPRDSELLATGGGRGRSLLIHQSCANKRDDELHAFLMASRCEQ